MGGYVTLNQLPEKLNSRFMDFMLEYIFQVLQNKTNWSNITVVTLDR
jgi:hypothetical protein